MKTPGKAKQCILPALLLFTCYLFSVTLLYGQQPLPADTLEVIFFDVGQGDAALVRTSEAVVVIDTGRYDRKDMVPYLQDRNVRHIDILVGTHPHADHIGQMDQILNTFSVSEVWMSGGETTTYTYERVLDAIIESDVTYIEPRKGDIYTVGTMSITVLHPNKLSGCLNNDSLVLRFDYQGWALLFTGDIEKAAEAQLLQNWDRQHLQSHILKIAHHGSSTSSTSDFMAAVNPQIAVYSASRVNPYGHPHYEVLERYREAGAALFGTDKHGTIRLLLKDIDGESIIHIEVERWD